MAFATPHHKTTHAFAAPSGPGAPRLPSRVGRARAQSADREAETGAPKFSISSSERPKVRFVESDSVGQTNIFNVQPTQYVQGSVCEVHNNLESNNRIAAGGALVGFVAIVLGITALTSLGDDSHLALFELYSV